jgi:hypothetical protein
VFEVKEKEEEKNTERNKRRIKTHVEVEVMKGLKKRPHLAWSLRAVKVMRLIKPSGVSSTLVLAAAELPVFFFPFPFPFPISAPFPSRSFRAAVSAAATSLSSSCPSSFLRCLLLLSA